MLSRAMVYPAATPSSRDLNKTNCDAGISRHSEQKALYMTFLDFHPRNGGFPSKIRVRTLSLHRSFDPVRGVDIW